MDLALLALKSIFFPMYSSASRSFWPRAVCHVAPSTSPAPRPVILLFLLRDKPSGAAYLRHALYFHASCLYLVPSSPKYIPFSSLSSELLLILQNATLIAPPLLSFRRLTYPRKIIVALPVSSKCGLHSQETGECVG